MDDFHFFYELMALTEALRTNDDQLREFAWNKMNLMLGGV